MTGCIQSPPWLKRRNRRQDKRKRVLKRMAQMRAAKERKRLAAGPRDEEPRMVRDFPLELGLRDTITGDVAWVPFKSVRDAARRLAVVCRYYLQPEL